MCSPPKAPSVPIPPPVPDFADEQVALAQSVAEEDRRRAFAGLSATLSPTGARGVLTPGRTSLNPQGGA